MAAALVVGVAGCGGGDAGPPTPATPTAPVVRVVSGAGAARDVATGVVTGDGRVLTVAHALAPGATVTVTEPDGGRVGGPVRARVVRADRRLDVAVLAVDGLRAGVPATAGVRAGEPATLVVLRGGERRTLDARVRRAITARVRAQPGDPPLVRPGLELAAAIEPGDSGAPVLDATGRLVGLVFAASSARPEVAYAVSAAAAVGVLGGG